MEQVPQAVERLRLQQSVSALHGKGERTIKHRQIVRPKASRLSLPEHHANHRLPVTDFVQQRSRVTVQAYAGRKTIEMVACHCGDERVHVEDHGHLLEAGP